MPTWSEQLAKVQAAIANNPRAFDLIRRESLVNLYKLTKRNVIVYATRWTHGDAPASLVSITDEDIHGLMEVVHGLTGPNLDIIIHSPGGSPGAAEAFVTYLRSKFEDIRVVVPHMAMSAATMIACAGDRILMGKHSFLGPIDPQVTMPTGVGNSLRSVPAQSIKDEFEMAVRECSDPKKVGAWMWKIQQYGPGILVVCDNAIALSKTLVKAWLKDYMFKGDSRASSKAKKIADWLGSHEQFKTHSRPLGRDVLEVHGLKIENLEDDQELQDAVLSVYHAFMITFSITSVAKIFENHLGKAYIKQARQAQGPPTPNPIPKPMPPGPPVPAPKSAQKKSSGKKTSKKVSRP